MTNEKLLTSKETAEIIGTTEVALCVARKRGIEPLIPYIKIGRRVRYSPEAVRRYLEDQAIDPRSNKRGMERRTR